MTFDKMSVMQELAKNQPDYHYEGAIPEDNDEMDYVAIAVKGVRIA